MYSPRYSREEVVRILSERVKRLREVVPVKKLILFGSYARNRYTAASDVDVLLVYDDTTRIDLDVYKVAWDILDIPEVELHVYKYSDYVKLKKSGNPFIRSVEEEGITIWDEDE
ncbi:nucleotidyltransferase domain-containing protein [Stetteria hydrogenophila]